MSYAQLLHAAKTDDPEIGRFFQTMQERVNEIGTQAPVLHPRDQPDRGRRARRPSSRSRPRLARYRPWLRDVRSFRPHQLDDEIERVLHEKSVTGRSAWVRLFDETMAGLRFPLDGRELTSAEIFDLLSDQDRARREAAGELDREVLGAQRPPVRADHQHARQGQADRGRLAPVRAPDLEPQPRQPGRGRGRRRADRRGPRRPTRACRTATTRSRRAGSASSGSSTGTATRRCPRTATGGSPGPRPRSSCSTPIARFSPQLAEIVERFFAGNWIDAALRPGQGCRRVLPPDRAERASLRADELPGPGARRDDARARARPRRASGARRRAGAADGRHAADARRDRLGVRRAADLPRAARGRDRPGAAPDHARRQDRGRAQHGGPADRLRRVRAPRPRRAPGRPS